MGIRDTKLANNPHQPTGTWIRPEKRLAIYLRDGFWCPLCGRDLAGVDPWAVTLDHVVPTSRGGSREPTNLYLCCRDCNTRRGARRLRGDELVAARTRTRRSLGRHLVAARALVNAATSWPAAIAAAGEVARYVEVDRCAAAARRP
jgi:5-methylcytosine-specific restriction endonuclease McrA